MQQGARLRGKRAGRGMRKGYERMRIVNIAGKFGAAVALAAFVGASTGASAQELSEDSLKKFMEYAWQLTPSKFTRPDGRTILIDKKKRDEVVVPLDVAREVIKVGRLSAHAQVCELGEPQVNNYRSLMLREEAKSKWSEQQLIYINQLHLTTVMLLTGKIKLVEKQGEKEVVVEESKSNTRSCTDEHRQKVAEMITAYVKSGPPLTAASAPATTGTTTGSLATTGVTPASASAPAAATVPPAKKK
jgi:hypothetical protein